MRLLDFKEHENTKTSASIPSTDDSEDISDSNSMDEFIVSDSDSEIYDTTDSEDSDNISISESDESVDDDATCDPNNIVSGKRISRPPQRYSIGPEFGERMIDDEADQECSSGSDFTVEDDDSDSDSDSDWE